MILSVAEIRAAVRADRVKWRYHALRRARQRGITRKEISRVLQAGEILEQDPKAKPFAKCLLMAMVEPERPLYAAVGYDREEKYLYIITVHWLDPEKWEDPWTRKSKNPKLE